MMWDAAAGIFIHHWTDACAGEAMATDVDPNAVSAAIENARVNHINMTNTM